MLVNTNWAVAIIASRESIDTLVSTVRASLAATPHSGLIDILVNGNADLAKDIAEWIATNVSARPHIRVWLFCQADKAHTWNEYVHRIWQSGRTAFILDGYARPRPNGLRQLAESLVRHPNAFGATGVPSSGRSAPALRALMLEKGGFHGNMHAIPAHAMAGLRAAGFRLPLGLYRTDSMISTVLMFGLDPTTQHWQSGRVVVNSDATWDVPGQSALTLQNVLSQLKRRLRQAQGDLENSAARFYFAVCRLPINQLPPTSRELVLNWIAAHPEQARRLYLKNPLCWHAALKMRRRQDWSAAKRLPTLLVDTSETRRYAGFL
ncbi:hypothetical protein [uncultured Massilia sp.]|uniref:hypothetical protein n=1 Tax=uncultured Massilia sp. TaxID=169973 RepID=UPI00258A186D|nr:hypothetical protein [uncultured Massilia sp.]